VHTESDFAIYGRDGQLLAVVEVKSRRVSTTVWAREFRHNLLVGPGLPKAVFVLATPFEVYVWDAGVEEDEPPTWSVAGEVVFGPYLAAAGVKVDQFIDPVVFEMIVARWLDDVVRGEAFDPFTDGFYKLLKNGRVVSRAAA
jgi:hypothetical protein